MKKYLAIGSVVTGLGVLAVAGTLWYLKKSLDNDLNFDDIRFDDWWNESLWKNAPLMQ
jgi:hypothetical protein